MPVFQLTKHVNITLHRESADVMKTLSMGRLSGRPKCSQTFPCEISWNSQKRESRCDPGRQGLEGWGHKPNKAASPRDWKRHQKRSSESPQRAISGDTLALALQYWLGNSSLKHIKRINFYCFMSLRFWLVGMVATWAVYYILSSLENYSEFHSALVSQICSLHVFPLSEKNTPNHWWQPQPLVLPMTSRFSQMSYPISFLLPWESIVNLTAFGLYLCFEPPCLYLRFLASLLSFHGLGQSAHIGN